MNVIPALKELTNWPDSTSGVLNLAFRALRIQRGILNFIALIHN